MGERGICPKSLVERVVGCRELGCCSAMCLCCVLVGLRFDGFVVVRSGLAWIDPMPHYGASCFPFYRQRGRADYIERKREKSQGEEGFQDHRAFLLIYAGPADTADGDRDGSTSGAYSPLMPHPSVVSGS